MSDTKQLLESSEAKGLELVNYISRHRTVIIFIVASAAILTAVLQTQSYLNPVRNEEKYQEIKSSVSVKQINQETLEKLEATLDDKENEANSNLAQDRTNPFTE